jgi:GNAT superfamily N-acetyltransferase
VAPALSRRVRLRDGTPAVLRPIVPDDRDAIVAFVARLSEDSRARRFLRPVDHLTDEELAYFTQVDHEDHEALVAVDPAQGELRAVARFVRFVDDRDLAEAAVVVEDAWQGRGLGSLLLEELARRARARGIRRFRVLMRADNRRAADLFGRLGTVVSRSMDDGVLDLEVALPSGVGAELARALAAAAAESVVCTWDLFRPPVLARAARRRG